MKKFLSLLVFCLSFLTSFAQLEHNFSVAKYLDIFNSIYRQLDIFYVDSLEAEKVIRVGIDAMTNDLDIYTKFYPEEDMGELKMMTTGKYGGIGSIIRMRKDSTVIIQEPYVDMPAAEVGLQVGDVLLKIDDKDLKGMNTTEVSDLLRGEPGTTFMLRVQRPGEKKTRDFKITRRSIKIPSIPYQGLVGDAGYIFLREFTEGCSKDMRKAIISLKEKGAKKIILDLRGNGGGLLNEAIDIVKKHLAQGHPLDKEALAKELEEGMRMNTSVVKQLTSTDDIYGEKKFCKPASFTPSHTLVLYTNHLPKVGATDEGTWRRLIVIPFNAVFEGRSDVKNYADYLFENAGPAVLSWIIEGAKRIIAKDFHLTNPIESPFATRQL